MAKEIIKFILCIIVLCCAGCSSEGSLRHDTTYTFSGYDWQLFVGSGTGIWVSIEKQELVLISDNQIVKRYPCSTAATGAGNVMDSGMTPLGWHRVGEKIGDGLEMGGILKDREWTGQIWKEGEDTENDLILSRILWLEGLEDGINRGGNVDTRSRYIYIHGTNAVDDLGRPASAGCVRLDPREVIDLYERVEVGTKVLITRD